MSHSLNYASNIYTMQYISSIARLVDQICILKTISKALKLTTDFTFWCLINAIQNCYTLISTHLNT